MAPRKFTKYFLVIGAGRNAKFARLNDSERCAHFLGVLSIAAQSPIRGYLLVGEEEAGAAEVASEAGVSEKVAASAIQKLAARGVLLRDEDHDCWRVHDWDDVNPPPKTDKTAAERQRRRRDKVKSSRNGHTGITPHVTHLSRRDERDVTALVTPPEVEVEVEGDIAVWRSGSESTPPREDFGVAA